MRGRKKTPTQTLKLRGSRYRNRPNEPQPKAEMPTMPGYLDEAAQELWAFLSPELFQAGILTNVDGAVLGALCQVVSRLHAAETLINQDGLIIDANGTPKAHPAVSIAAKCREHVQRLSAELGMTPAGRARLNVKTKGGGEDEFETYLKKGRA